MTSCLATKFLIELDRLNEKKTRYGHLNTLLGNFPSPKLNNSSIYFHRTEKTSSMWWFLFRHISLSRVTLTLYRRPNYKITSSLYIANNVLHAK